MDDRLDEILTAANWKEMTPRLLYYAESLIRNCRWRGVPVTCARGQTLCVDARDADDFLHLAIERILDGKRTYDYSISLEQNLRRAIRSIIWSANKSCRRSQVSELPQGENEAPEIMDSFAAPGPLPDAEVSKAEQLDDEKRTLAQFEHALHGDKELLRLVDAYKAGHFKPRDVERFTTISASRVSELKRKLRRRLEQFEAHGPQHQND